MKKMKKSLKRKIIKLNLIHLESLLVKERTILTYCHNLTRRTASLNFQITLLQLLKSVKRNMSSQITRNILSNHQGTIIMNHSPKRVCVKKEQKAIPNYRKVRRKRIKKAKPSYLTAVSNS
jgi:hypothetical protein